MVIPIANSNSPQFEPGFHIQTCIESFVEAARIKSFLSHSHIPLLLS